MRGCRGDAVSPAGVWGSAPRCYNGQVKRETYREAAERHPDALPLPFDVIMTDHGFDALYDVCMLLGGETVHIPMPKRMFSQCVANMIRQEYTGFNKIELAKKYCVSVRHVERLVK